MATTNRRVAAKKVLDGAKKYAGKDVIVVSKDKAGNLYLASSMPSGSSQQLEAQITLVNEGLKLLRRVHRKEQRREKAVAQEQIG
jgi:hypothetical protein